MKRLIFSLIIVALTGFVLSSCEDDCPVCPPTPEKPTYYGWAVGLSDDYGPIFHTTDGGNTWARQGDSLQFLNEFFNDICIINKSTLVVVGTNVFKSVNGGNTWTLSGSGDLGNHTYGGIFALDENNIWIVGNEGSVYYSTDVAESWIKLEVPAEYQGDSFERIAAKSKDDIWVVGDKHVNDEFPIMLHTTNGGADWERLNPLQDLNITGANQDHFLGIKIFGNSIWALGGFERFIIRSGDNGATWENITVPGTGGIYDANDIFLLSETEAYVVQDFGLIFSTNDAGMNWTQYCAAAGNNWVLGIAILNNINIWICGSAAGWDATSIIKYSSDAGTTWQDQTPQLLIDNPKIALYKIRFIEVTE